MRPSLPSGLVFMSPFPTEDGCAWNLTPSKKRTGRRIHLPSGSAADIQEFLGASKVYADRSGTELWFEVGRHQYIKAILIASTVTRLPSIHVTGLEAA